MIAIFAAIALLIILIVYDVETQLNDEWKKLDRANLAAKLKNIKEV